MAKMINENTSIGALNERMRGKRTMTYAMSKRAKEENLAGDLLIGSKRFKNDIYTLL